MSQPGKHYFKDYHLRDQQIKDHLDRYTYEQMRQNYLTTAQKGYLYRSYQFI